MQLTGIHHLTAISADISGNHRFYTRVLGMRLVKRSVNQDDVRAYHLFYADSVGSPGTDITFFDWPVPPERRGTHSIVLTHLRVRDASALSWWESRLQDQGVDHDGVAQRDGRRVLDFRDPEGQRLSLIEDGGLGDPPVPWKKSPVPEPQQIRGLGPIVMSVPGISETDLMLTRALHMRQARDYKLAASQVRVYEMGEGGPHAELHVAIQPDLPVARQGAGAVHHVAFRTPDEAEYHRWTERLNALGIPNSGEIDRYYFRSLYFREPNGVLFEIATDGPGFAVDEDPYTLGEAIALPPFLESKRASIEANLKPIE
jgi:glyoxalase family protein